MKPLNPNPKKRKCFEREFSPEAESASMETVAGTKDIRYHEDGFLIARLDTGVTVKGKMLWPEIGMHYTFTGCWERHPRFGDGFKFEDYHAKHPTGIAAIQEYLVENADGIGSIIAEKLTAAFGERTLEVLKMSRAKRPRRSRAWGRIAPRRYLGSSRRSKKGRSYA